MAGPARLLADPSLRPREPEPGPTLLLWLCFTLRLLLSIHVYQKSCFACVLSLCIVRRNRCAVPLAKVWHVICVIFTFLFGHIGRCRWR